MNIPGLLSGREFNFLGILGNVITWFLWLAGALAFIYLVYGGIVYITAAGNEERAKAGKTAIISAIIGIIIVSISLVITEWIMGIIQTGGL